MVLLLNTMLQRHGFMPCTKIKSALELVFIVLEKAYWLEAIYSRGIRLNSRPAITK